MLKSAKTQMPAIEYRIWNAEDRSLTFEIGSLPVGGVEGLKVLRSKVESLPAFVRSEVGSQMSEIGRLNVLRLDLCEIKRAANTRIKVIRQ